MGLRIGSLVEGDRVKIIASKLPLRDKDYDCVGTVESVIWWDAVNIGIKIQSRNAANTCDKFFQIVGLSDYEADFLEFIPGGKIPNAAAVTERDCVVCKRKNYTDAKCCWWCGCQNPTCSPTCSIPKGNGFVYS